MNREPVFATALDCMDGRTKTPMSKMIKNLKFDYADVITEPGIDGILAGNKQSNFSGEITLLTSWIKYKVWISIFKHTSQAIFITGHADCAGNLDSQERVDLTKAIELVRKWVKGWKKNIPVTGIWVDQVNNEWQIKEEIK